MNLNQNIALYRKHCGYTQEQLAERLGVSAQSVSKWETGANPPDIALLPQLAELFGITVNDLLTDPDALPENPGKVEQVMTMAVEKAMKRKANKRIILGLSSLLVWFVALLLFLPRSLH